MIPLNDTRPQYAAIGAEVRAAMDGVLERSWFVLGEEVADSSASSPPTAAPARGRRRQRHRRDGDRAAALGIGPATR